MTCNYFPPQKKSVPVDIIWYLVCAAYVGRPKAGPKKGRLQDTGNWKRAPAAFFLVVLCPTIGLSFYVVRSDWFVLSRLALAFPLDRPAPPGCFRLSSEFLFYVRVEKLVYEPLPTAHVTFFALFSHGLSMIMLVRYAYNIHSRRRT